MKNICLFVLIHFNSLETSFDLHHLEGNKNLVQDFSYPELQPLNPIDCKVADEDMEVGPYNQMMQDDSMTFFFESFQFLKGKLHSISSNEQPVESHKISSEPIENGLQQYFQAFHDPIFDLLDNVRNQIPSPIYELHKSIDTNLIWQLVSL